MSVRMRQVPIVKISFSIIFTYVVILLETRKNPKFECLKINNGQDMAILRFLINGSFAKNLLILEL